MFEDFERYIIQNLPELTSDQLQLIRSRSVIQTVRRKQVLLHVGEVCRQKMFVLRGLLRTYKVAPDGNEYIMKFSAEHEWLVDPDSYNYQTPAELTIDAVEAGEVMAWNHDDFEILRASIPQLNTFSEKLMSRTISDTQKRILMTISATAEEKYQNFLATYPDIFRRVPLHMVASYLGVSRETLTRIRQGQVIAAKG